MNANYVHFYYCEPCKRWIICDVKYQADPIFPPSPSSLVKRTITVNCSSCGTESLVYQSTTDPEIDKR